MAESTLADFRRFGSPTVLVDGEDVTGDQNRRGLTGVRYMG